MLFEFILGGALVGFVVGATGVGGGSLMTPLLTLVFGVPAPVAVGTDLLFASITKAGGAWTFGRRGHVQWPIAGFLVLGSVPAALATLAAIRIWHPDSAQFAALVRPALAAALLLTALALLFKNRIQAVGRRFAGLALAGQVPDAERAAAPAGVTAPRPVPTVLLGAVIGSLVAVTSVGAGVIGVVALFFLYPALPARQLVAVDVAHAVPLTLVAGLGHVALGTVDWSMLGALLIGSLPAITAGALVAERLPERALRASLAGMLALIGARLLAI